MALGNFLDSFSDLNVKENDSQQTWNQFLIFDFAALRRIKFVDNEMLCQASQILHRFIRSSRTRLAFLANHHNCLTYSLDFLRKELFMLCKHYDETKQSVIITLSEVFKELIEGLLNQQTDSKIIYQMDGSFAVLDLLIESDFNASIKLPCYAIIELLLKLVLSKRASIEDKSILSTTMAHIFQNNGNNIEVLRQLCCIASIYFKGVAIKVFDEFDFLYNWIELECIGSISKTLEESALMDILRCASILCKFTKIEINSLINKLDIFIHLSQNKLLEHDLIIIITKAISTTCKNVGMALPFENFLESEVKQVIRQFHTCSNDLIFVILYLEATYSQLSLTNVQLKQVICTKLDDTPNLSEAVLKSIAVLFPITFQESDVLFKDYSDRLFEDISKVDNLDTIIAYDKHQLYWIMKNSSRALKWRVLKLWIKNCEDQGELIVQIVRDTKCGYLLPEYLKTDIQEKIQPFIKALNDPDVSNILCEMIPKHLLQMESLRILINAGAAAPKFESIAESYVKFFLNIITHRLYKDCLTPILNYVFTIGREYQDSIVIAKRFCDPIAIQGVLDAIYDEQGGSDAWNHAVNILYVAGKMQKIHKIEVQKPVEVDIVKLLSKLNSDESKIYVRKYDTIIRLMKYILNMENSEKILKLSSGINLGLMNLLLDSPDNADLKTVLKVLKKLLDFYPDMAHLPTLSCYISYTCETIESTDAHFQQFLELLRRFLLKRKISPWPILSATKQNLLSFGNRFNHLCDLDFLFNYFQDSAEIEFATEILNELSL